MNLDLTVQVTIIAAFSVGMAIQKTGLADAVAQMIILSTSHFGTVGTLILLYLVTNFLTEMITNNAAIIIMFPIALATAVKIGVPPRPFLLAVTVAASASFLTPIGYQTNLIVMGPGRYRFTDFLRAGAPVTVIVMFVTIAMIQLFWL